jgi:DNA (cytosine-5)-methyltransferase 1
MKVVGLFAGVGGFERGLARSGHQALYFCENWAPAVAVLRARFPDVPNHPDIREPFDLPGDTELLCAGFPCQDLSQAGKTVGIDGERSGLVRRVFDLLTRRRVPWVVLENVSFMLHLNGGRALHHLVSALEELGYRWAYRKVNSLGFVPQRRERIFLVASLDGDPADVLFVDEAFAPAIDTRLDTHAHGFYWTEGTRGLGWAPDAVPTLKNGSTVGIASPPAILMPCGRIITPDIRDAERLQGFPADWTQPAERVGRMSLRWSLVGNAVTVPVAEWIGRRLAQPGQYNRDRDRLLPRIGKWPAAARYDGSRRFQVTVSPFPVWTDRPALHEFLKHDGRPLSPRAARGFLGRADASSLRFVEGFKDRVRAHMHAVETQPPPELIAA